MRQNPFEKFKKRGVRGSVPNDFESIKIYDRAGESVMIYIGKLDSESYDFGYELNLKDGTHLKKLPGIGSGYFTSRQHAVGYVLNAITGAFSSRLSQPVVQTLRHHINELMMPKLDLI